MTSRYSAISKRGGIAHRLRRRGILPGMIMTIGLLGSFGVSPGQADDASVYAGKTIRILVGFNPGGGYDTYARLLARHIGRHIPGKPAVIVQNMPGSGSLKAVKMLDMRAGNDGTTITIFNPGLITQSITAPKTVNVNFKNYAWLGSISEDIRVCFLWHARNVKALDDLAGQKPLMFGATTPGTLGYIEARIMKEYLHVPLKLVPGYPGSAEKRLAIENGELEGDCGGWVNTPPQWVADKKINVLVRYSKTILPGLDASMPYVGDLIHDPLRKKSVTLLGAPEEIGRPFIVSKQTPPERLKVLQTAFDETMKDEQFIADATRLRLTLSPMSGREVQARLADIYEVQPGVIEEAKRISSAE